MKKARIVFKQSTLAPGSIIKECKEVQVLEKWLSLYDENGDLLLQIALDQVLYWEWVKEPTKFKGE